MQRQSFTTFHEQFDAQSVPKKQLLWEKSYQPRLDTVLLFIIMLWNISLVSLGQLPSLCRLPASCTSPAYSLCGQSKKQVRNLKYTAPYGLLWKSTSIWARYNALLSKYVFAKQIEVTMYEPMKNGKLGSWRRKTVVHSPAPIQVQFYWVAPLDHSYKTIFDTFCNITRKNNTSSFLAGGCTHYITEYEDVPVWLNWFGLLLEK